MTRWSAASGPTAGNIGHLAVADDGPECTCGSRGCLGTLITPAALVREALAGEVFGKEFAVAERADGDDLLADGAAVSVCWLRGPPGLNRELPRLVHRAAQRIARAVVLLVNLLDIEEVVLGGPFWQPLAEPLLAVLPGLVSSSAALISTHPVRFRSSEVGEDTAAVGAACLVLDAALSPRASSLLITA